MDLPRTSHVVIIFVITPILFLLISNWSFDTRNDGSILHEEQVPSPSSEDHYRWKSLTGVTVINYFSLDCPHCRELFLKEEEALGLYNDSFSLIYRHSPLPLIQPLSFEKSVIAECLFRETNEDTFFAFLKEVFTAYHEHRNNDWVKDLAKNYVTNDAQFETCLTTYGKDLIEESLKMNLSHTVYGTPTIIVFEDNVQTMRLNMVSARATIRLYDSLRLQHNGNSLIESNI